MNVTRHADQPGNPWINLAPYEERQAHLFCGRDAAIASLTQRVLANRVTVLIGPSGCGKSSLLRAGTFPALRESGWLPVPVKIDFSDVSLHGMVRQIIAQIECCVAERPAAFMGIETPDPTVFAEVERQSLWEYLQRIQIWTRGAELAKPVLVFDQFEEFFSLGAANPHIRGWLRELSDAFENNRPEAVRQHLEATRSSLPFPFLKDNARFVVALRSDRMALLTEHRAVLPSLALNRNHELLHPFTGEEALQAVLEPPRRAGLPHLLNESTARAVVRRVAARHDAPSDSCDLPLEALTVEPAVLSVECHELFQAKGDAPSITLELLEQSHEDILSTFYEHAVAKLPARVARFVETRLVEGDVRTPVPLRVAREDYRLSEADLAALKHACLVREERRGDDSFIELTHDVLIAPIRERARQRRIRATGRSAMVALVLAGIVGGTLFILLDQQIRIKAMRPEIVKLTSAETERDTLKQETESLREQNIRAAGEIASLRARLSEVNNQLGALMQDKERAMQAKQRAEEECKRLAGEIESLREGKSQDSPAPPGPSTGQETRPIPEVRTASGKGTDTSASGIADSNIKEAFGKLSPQMFKRIGTFPQDVQRSIIHDAIDSGLINLDEAVRLAIETYESRNTETKEEN